MRILVFGAGAIGSVLGGFLAKAGHDVTLLGRAWHLDAVRQHGLQIDGLWGAHRIEALTTATRLEDVKRQPEFDWIFVCVKAHQTREVAQQLTPLLGPQTLVCAFQNGLNNYEALTACVDPSRVALGRIIFGVELEPGHVRVTVCADDVVIGAPDSRVPRARLDALVAALKASGIPTRLSANILIDLWGKVFYNCALNGLATLLEVPYGKLLDHPQARDMMRRIIEEAYAVAAASQVSLNPPTAKAYQELLFTRLIPATAAHHPSMLQDVQRGRLTEIDAMNGAIARLAQAKHVAAPTNTLITRLVHEKERMAGVS